MTATKLNQKFRRSSGLMLVATTLLWCSGASWAYSDPKLPKQSDADYLKTIRCYVDLNHGPQISKDAHGLDLGTAHALAVFSMVAYLDKENATFLAQEMGFPITEFFEAEKEEAKTLPDGSLRIIESNTQGLWAENDQMIVLAFRGTEPNNFKDIKTDLMLVKEGMGPLGKVHSGFYGALTTVWKTLATRLKSVKATKPIFITGHSLGGALATLSAAQLLQKQTREQDRAATLYPASIERWSGAYVQGLYTFGSPRVGDETFATLTDYLFSKSRTFALPGLDLKPLSYSARFVHNVDLVPRLPGERISEYRHIKGLEYFDQTGSLYHEENAKDRFPDSIATLPLERGGDWISDHDTRYYAEDTYRVSHDNKSSGCLER